MYTSFQLAKKYLRYYLAASNGKGHGIHSPFVFEFVRNVLNAKKSSPLYDRIEEQRRSLLKDRREIEVEDFGAGSGHLKFKTRRIKDIASTSLKPRKYARLLGEIVAYFSPNQVVELGTSLGLTSMYLAATGKPLITLEGAFTIAAVARNNFDKLNFKNIEVLVGPFEQTLPELADKNIKPGLVFLDGNHRKQPTLDYFKFFLQQHTEQSVFIFDDIHWSLEMEEAWEEIKRDESVTLTIDLFFIGVVFFRKDFKSLSSISSYVIRLKILITYLSFITSIMVIGVLKEPQSETRVSLLPEHVALIKKMNSSVVVEQGAGINSFANDDHYLVAGAELKSREQVLASADIILCMNELSSVEMQLVQGKTLVGLYFPLQKKELIPTWASTNANIFSMDMLPRTTRAQSMDVLSSQANISGYKAVLLAANTFPKYFPMFMTAAGSIPPAKMLILGAGVAGLQAIATAKRLGAVVEVFDTRPAVKEEVNSLGAKFVEVEGAADPSQAGGYAVEQTEEFKQRQQQKISESVAKADIVITTAQIPGRKAPILITDEMLGKMKNGSVIVDLAASTGGNTSQTLNAQTIVYNGVKIVGNSTLAAEMPSDASKLYGKNICNFLQLIITKEGELNLNFEDDLVKGACLVSGGKIVNERVL